MTLCSKSIQRWSQRNFSFYQIIVYDFDRKYQKHVPLWLEDSTHLFYNYNKQQVSNIFICFMILSRHDICWKFNFSWQTKKTKDSCNYLTNYLWWILLSFWSIYGMSIYTFQINMTHTICKDNVFQSWWY